MSLRDDIKVSLRVSSVAVDTEVDALISAAVSDMRRVGVHEELLDTENPHPLVRMAITCYAKAAFGYDNSEAPRFQESYRQIVCDLMNSSWSMCEEDTCDSLNP